MEIGDRIRETRKKRGITLREFVDRTGLSLGFLSDLENNKSNPSVTTCRTIADVLGVPVSRLLGEQAEDTVLREGDAFTVTWRCPEAERLVGFLKDFDDWRAPDKSELLAYLKAKELARRQASADKGEAPGQTRAKDDGR